MQYISPFLSAQEWQGTSESFLWNTIVLVKGKAHSPTNSHQTHSKSTTRLGYHRHWSAVVFGGVVVVVQAQANGSSIYQGELARRYFVKDRWCFSQHLIKSPRWSSGLLQAEVEDRENKKVKCLTLLSRTDGVLLGATPGAPSAVSPGIHRDYLPGALSHHQEGALHHLARDWTEWIRLIRDWNWVAFGIACETACHGLRDVVLSFSAGGDNHHSASRPGGIIVNS